MSRALSIVAARRIMSRPRLTTSRASITENIRPIIATFNGRVDVDNVESNDYPFIYHGQRKPYADGGGSRSACDGSRDNKQSWDCFLSKAAPGRLGVYILDTIERDTIFCCINESLCKSACEGVASYNH